jgi:hypothetical protein
MFPTQRRQVLQRLFIHWMLVFLQDIRDTFQVWLRVAKARSSEYGVCGIRVRHYKAPLQRIPIQLFSNLRWCAVIAICLRLVSTFHISKMEFCDGAALDFTWKSAKNYQFRKLCGVWARPFESGVGVQLRLPIIGQSVLLLAQR